MWPFKPKLKLVFQDKDYDDVMNLFRQIIYINKIQEVVGDASSPVQYCTELMDSFVNIYNNALSKIGARRQRKRVDLTEINKERFTKELGEVGVSFEEASNYDDKTFSLLTELHVLRREDRYNRIVSETYIKTLKTIVDFSTRLDKETTFEKSEFYRTRYGMHLLNFLKAIKEGMKLYDWIGRWLRDDRRAIEKYKKGLGKRITKHVGPITRDFVLSIKSVKNDRVYIADRTSTHKEIKP